MGHLVFSDLAGVWQPVGTRARHLMIDCFEPHRVHSEWLGFTAHSARIEVFGLVWDVFRWPWVIKQVLLQNQRLLLRSQERSRVLELILRAALGLGGVVLAWAKWASKGLIPEPIHGGTELLGIVVENGVLAELSRLHPMQVLTRTWLVVFFI